MVKDPREIYKCHKPWPWGRSKNNVCRDVCQFYRARQRVYFCGRAEEYWGNQAANPNTNNFQPSYFDMATAKRWLVDKTGGDILPEYCVVNSFNYFRPDAFCAQSQTRAPKNLYLQGNIWPGSLDKVNTNSPEFCKRLFSVPETCSDETEPGTVRSHSEKWTAMLLDRTKRMDLLAKYYNDIYSEKGPHGLQQVDQESGKKIGGIIPLSSLECSQEELGQLKEQMFRTKKKKRSKSERTRDSTLTSGNEGSTAANLESGNSKQPTYSTETSSSINSNSNLITIGVNYNNNWSNNNWSNNNGKLNWEYEWVHHQKGDWWEKLWKRVGEQNTNAVTEISSSTNTSNLNFNQGDRAAAGGHAQHAQSSSSSNSSTVTTTVTPGPLVQEMQPVGPVWEPDRIPNVNNNYYSTGSTIASEFSNRSVSSPYLHNGSELTEKKLDIRSGIESNNSKANTKSSEVAEPVPQKSPRSSPKMTQAKNPSPSKSEKAIPPLVHAAPGMSPNTNSSSSSRSNH